MTKQQATLTVSIALTSAIQHLAAIHQCSEDLICNAIRMGNTKIIDQVAALVGRFEQSL
jgi:hypothetical protein